MVQFGIAELQRGLRIAGRELLPQEICHVIGSEGTGGKRLLQSCGHGLGTVLPDQLEKFGDLTGERAIGVGQTAKVGFDRFLTAVTDQQGDQAPLRLGALSSGPMGEQFFLETLGPEGLTASPAARVANDFLIAVIKRHRGSIGLDGETLAHEMRRGAVAIAVELKAKILMHQGLGRVAVIGSEGRQRSQTIRAKALAGSLAGFAVQALVGNLVQPLPRLAIDIGEIGKLAERPEVLADIADASAFDLAFFPARRRVAGAGKEATLAGEAQKARIEADQGTHVFGDDGQKIVVPAFASNAVQSLEGMQVATDESLEALTVSELDVEHPAVTLDQAEGIELPQVAGVVQGAEVTPVDLVTLGGSGLHAHEGARRVRQAP